MVTDGREEMVNRLCLYIESISNEKIAEIKSAMYLLLNDFEITSRSTELAEVQTDRNEYLMKKFLIAKKSKGMHGKNAYLLRKRIKLNYARNRENSG